MPNAYFAFLALLALTFPAGAVEGSASSPSSWSRASVKPGDFYQMPTGIGDDFGQAATPEKIEADVKLAKQLGAKFLRFGVSWLEVETSEGKYDWEVLDRIVAAAEREHVQLMPYVCYTPQWISPEPASEEFWNMAPKDLSRFGHFMGALADRYKGKIGVWGLWNEPDIDIFWGGTPHEYAEMIRHAKAEILSVNPAATVYLGGFGNAPVGFFRKAVIEEGLAKEFSIIGVHGYPETLNDKRVEQAYPAAIDKVQRALVKAGASVALWLEESGYSNYRFSPRNVTQYEVVPAVYDYEHTPAFQALNLWKQHVLALGSSSISLIGWYRIHDLPAEHSVIGDDNNKFFGLLDVANAPKPAFAALKLFNELFDGPTRNFDKSLKISAQQNSQAVVHGIEKQSGEVVLTAWLRSSLPTELKDQSGNAKDTRPAETLTVSWPVSAPFQRAEWRDLSGQLVGKQSLGGRSSIKLENITGNRASVVVLIR